ncbi:MAG: chemotaxis protein CheX [Acidimicrobiales bacterium]
MQLTDEDLQYMLTELWSSMLDLALDDEIDPTAAHDLSWCAAVDILSDDVVTGTVMVRCGDELAERIAEALFGLPSGSASFGEVRDAMGEVANIVGGNVKGVLDAATVLGLPRTSRGEPATSQAPVNRLLLASEGYAVEASYSASAMEGAGR